MKFEAVMNDARKTYELMKDRYPGFNWGVDEFMLQLVEELGELSNAVLCETGRKLKQRQKSTIEDAVFDVLFYLLLLADTLDVNLEDAWERGIAELTQRIEAGF